MAFSSSLGQARRRWGDGAGVPGPGAIGWHFAAFAPWWSLSLFMRLSPLFPLQVITNLVKMLKSRDTRRNFCPPNHWLSEQEDIKADKVY